MCIDLIDIDTLLLDDPAGVYPRMDSASKAAYKASVRELARYCDVSESEIVRTANAFADEAKRTQPGSHVYRFHNGFYICAEGCRQVCQACHASGKHFPTFNYLQRRKLVRTYCWLYYGLALLLTTIMVWALPPVSKHLAAAIFGTGLIYWTALASSLTLVGIATLITNTVAVLPCLQLTNTSIGESEMVFAIPCKLLNLGQVELLASKVEALHLANRALGCRYVLLTDHKDSKERHRLPEEVALERRCVHLIQDLNHKYADGPSDRFVFLHRDLTYDKNQGLWMGWERKRGKLEEFYRLTRKQPSGFQLLCGQTSSIAGIRYVMVLDEDTEIAANDVLQLLGTIKHPLNEAVIDDTTKRVLRGFGVVQPISRVSERSAAHWRYPEFLFGPIGAPKPGEQTAHQLQNLLGQSVFTGKGIIDLEAYGRVIAGRFPDNILLSHDHVEGAYLKTATDCRAFILEDAPTTAQSSSMRQHRWMRGEWHNILWLAPLVKVGTGGTERNPLELFHRWVLAESIRRSNQSLVLAALILLIRMNDARTFVIWSISIAVLLQLPAYVTRVLVIAHKIKEKRPLNIRLDLTDPAIDAHVRIAFFFITAGHDGLISLDAFLRSMFRLATGRRRLEWTSSSQSTAFGRQHRSFVFSAYSLTYISGIFLILIAMVEGLHAALSYLPIWLVWDCAPLLAWWLQLPARRLDSSTEQTHQ